jgi:hypothetical protein
MSSKRLDKATKLYPTHFGVWFRKFYTSMLGARPQPALAFAADNAERPTGTDPVEIDAAVRLAKAIQSGSQVEVDAVTRKWMEHATAGLLADVRPRARLCRGLRLVNLSPRAA